MQLVFDLFGSGKKPVLKEAADSSDGFQATDATRPLVGARTAPRPNPVSGQAANPPSQRMQRMARREQVFQLVRESMVRAGVLTSGYKFKVLSIDQRGTTFVVMMDLAAEFGGQTDRLAEIEALIAQSAKHRYNLMVQAVYWRFNEHVVLGQPGAAQAAHQASAPAGPAAAPNALPLHLQDTVRMAVPPSMQDTVRMVPPPYEPLNADEVTAFKRALEAGAATAPEPAVLAAQARNDGLLLTGYEETEIVDENDGLPALSTTQYGALR